MPQGGHNKGNGPGLQWLKAHVGHEGTECLIRPFSKQYQGYGQVGVSGKIKKAHRVMCELVNGPPPTRRHYAARLELQGRHRAPDQDARRPRIHRRLVRREGCAMNTAVERKPWKDGIDSAGLWTYSSTDRFTRKAIRNDALWEKIAGAREAIIAAALAWRDAAIGDGWTSRPTYDHESELTAFTLERDGFKVQGLARPSQPESMGHGEISCWGPDRLHIPVGEIYDWEAIQRAVETCGYCGAHPVKTERVGFVGRCCAACLPTMRARIETPGWAE